MLLSRRTLLFATAAVPLTHSQAFGAVEYRGARVGFAIDGQQFGLVVTQVSKGILVTVRSLSGSFRAAGLVKPEVLTGAKQVTLSGGGRKVNLSVGADEALKVSGGGVRLVSVEPSPEPAEPTTQGFFGRLMGAIYGVLEAVAVGIAAGAAWLVGAEFRYEGRRFGIWVDGQGVKLWIYGSGDGVVPPPDDIEEDPTVWY